MSPANKTEPRTTNIGPAKRGKFAILSLEWLKETIEQIENMSAQELIRAFPEEFFKHAIIGMRFAGYQSKHSGDKMKFDIAKYFVDKVGDEKFMKKIMELMELDQSGKLGFSEKAEFKKQSPEKAEFKKQSPFDK